jgi:hypothetical protein
MWVAEWRCNTVLTLTPKVSGQLTTSAMEKEPLGPLDRRQGGPQSWSGCCVIFNGKLMTKLLNLVCLTECLCKIV